MNVSLNPGIPMKRSRIIFYVIFALFHIGAFIFTIALARDSSFLMSMFSWVPYFKWVTLAGLVFVLIDVIWSWASAKERRREKEALAHEVNTLKAKLFDMQEDMNKAKSVQKPISPPPSQH
jgi:membrane protein implicated in regulation of membrane protease activity